MSNRRINRSSITNKSKFTHKHHQSIIYNTHDIVCTNFVESQKIYLKLIKDIKHHNTDIFTGKKILVSDGDGNIYIKKQSQFASQKRKDVDIQQSIEILNETFPHQRSKKLQRKIKQFTKEISQKYPNLKCTLKNIHKCDIISTIDELIKSENINCLKNIDISEWTYDNIFKLLVIDNRMTSTALNNSIILLNIWIDKEDIKTCLRGKSPIIYLLKIWIDQFDKPCWFKENNISSIERQALIYFNNYLNHITTFPKELIKMLREIQARIDNRNLQLICDDPLIINVLFLRHFIPLYYSKTNDNRKTEIAKYIMLYCDNVPLIARDYYMDVCKLLRL